MSNSLYAKYNIQLADLNIYIQHGTRWLQEIEKKKKKKKKKKMNTL